jgi:hypothetical protein
MLPFVDDFVLYTHFMVIGTYLDDRFTRVQVSFFMMDLYFCFIVSFHLGCCATFSYDIDLGVNLIVKM